MSIQSTLSALRQSQSTVEMTIGDGMTERSYPSFISSPIGHLLLNFNPSGSFGYVYIGNALRVGFEQHNTGDVTLDFMGYSQSLDNLLNTDYSGGNLTITNYNIYGTLGGSISAGQWFGAGLSVIACPNIAAADFSSGGFGDNATGNVYFTNCGQLTNIYLASIYGEAGFTNLPSLGVIYFFGNVATQVWLTDGLSPNLATVVFESAFYGSSIQFLGCALTQSSVDGILNACMIAGQSNGTVNLSGGTSSPPTLDVGGAQAYIQFDLANSSPTFTSGNSYWFQMWDGNVFWFLYDTVGDGSGSTAAPGYITNQNNVVGIDLGSVNNYMFGNAVAAIVSALQTYGYTVSTDGGNYISASAAAGYQAFGANWSAIPDGSLITSVSSGQGSANNASSKVLTLQGLGWSIITN